MPKGTIEEAVKYLERCQTPEGGIQYSLGSGGGPRIAISAAAIATLYNAGDYDSKLADLCLAYVKKQFDQQKGNWSKGGGHDFYTHLYASQAFYQAGDKYWDDYFPSARDQLLRMQARDGSWQGDGIGNDLRHEHRAGDPPAAVQVSTDLPAVTSEPVARASCPRSVRLMPQTEGETPSPQKNREMQRERTQQRTRRP